MLNAKGALQKDRALGLPMRMQMQLKEKAPNYSSLGNLTRAPCSGCIEGEGLCRSAAVWELPGAFLQPGALSGGGVVPLQRHV